MAQSQGQNPGEPAYTAGLPANADFFDFAGWNGIDSKPKRPAVSDEHVSWSKNLMFLGANNIRALPDVAAPIYGTPVGRSIVHFDFFILQPQGVFSGPSMAVFLDDGSALWINLTSGINISLAPAGTFGVSRPIATRQWGTQYLLIATEQNSDAYWIWDGTLLYHAGGLGPQASLTSGGISYTSAPGVTIVGGSGGGASASAMVLNGSVAQVTITGTGANWLPSDATQVGLIFSGGGGGSSAYGFANVVDGAIVSAQVISGGGSYTSPPAVAVADPTGSGASLIVSAMSGGTVSAITVLSPGANYTNPTISFSGGAGGGAAAEAVLQSGVIVSVTLISNGLGYGAQPTPRFIAATGSGASATAVLHAGEVVGLDYGLGNNNANALGFTGEGYPTAANAVLVLFDGGNGPASGTVQLMPFGIQGHAIEVYQSRAWIASDFNVVKVFFTAPNAVANFGPPDGGGAFPATDSVLRYSWINLLQSNGFLYLLGDSSVNYISGVTTSGSPAITTFSNLNVDPDTGTPFRDSAITFGRAVVMANQIGVYAIYGGAVQKISDQLDGIFNSGNLNNVLYQQPSSAKAEIFGTKVYMLLLPIIDPDTKAAVNALLLWDGKRWFPAESQVAFTYIRTLEVGSQIDAFGTDGHGIYQLFALRTGLTEKVLQSKQWIRPNITEEKKSWMIYALWQGELDTTLTFSIDTERGSAAVTQGAFSSTGTAIGWARSKAADSAGMVMGWTMRSTSPDFTAMNVSLMLQDYRLRT